MKLMILAVVLATATAFGQTFVDNGAAGTSFTGTWITSSIAGSYGVQSTICNTAGATYTFSAPATGIIIVSLWWTADTNRCDAVAVAVFDGASQVGSSILNQRIAGSRWVTIGTFTFTGTARVVLTAGIGGYTVADGMKLELSGEPPPPPPLPTSKFLLSWTAVTTYVDGTPCAPTGYEIWATPATVDLVANPANDTGAVKRMVPPNVTANFDATAMILSATKATWRLWVRTMADGLVSDWSNPVTVIYDPTLPDPIQSVTPTAPVLSGAVTR